MDLSILNVVQIAVTIVGLMTTVGMSVFLAMIVYMLRRRDKEIDRLVSKVDTLENRSAGHDVDITVLQSEVEGMDEIRKDLKEIRESIQAMNIGLVQITQELADKHSR